MPDELRAEFGIEADKTRAVESPQAVPGRNPEITIAALGDGIDAIARQVIIEAPGVHQVIAWWNRPHRQRRQASEDQQQRAAAQQGRDDTDLAVGHNALI